MSLQQKLKEEFEQAAADIDANYDVLMKQQAADNDTKMELYAKQRDAQRDALGKRYGFAEDDVAETPEVAAASPSLNVAS